MRKFGTGWATKQGNRAAKERNSRRSAAARCFELVVAILAGVLPFAPALAQVTPPSFATCDTRAFLFQSSPTDVFAVDLVTGAAPLAAGDIAAYNINGVAFNPLDNYIYGVATDSAVIGHFIRVGSDFSVQDLGVPTGMPGGTGFNIGEFDNNGHYWVMAGGATTTVYEVDLRPGSATYFRVVGSRALTTPAGFNGGADWAFDPVDGFLYRTMTNTTTGRVTLFRYNRSNGVQANLGAVAGIAADTTIIIGANYSDAAGFIYGSDNASGRIFRINPATVSGALLSTGPVSGLNDGARCFNAQVPIDFGDAPDTYGTTLAANGARHSIPRYNAAAKTAPLMIGSRISAEADGVPSSDASTDSFDDGIVPGSINLTAGATTASATLNVVNAKATPATLAGWIDFNGNGTFEAGERTQATIPANTNAATPFTLNWTGLSPIPSGFSSPARFRVASNAAQVANPTGSAADGEVEDYVVPITLPPIDCSANPSIFNTAFNSANGGSLPPGSRDRNWDAGVGTATGGPSSVTSWIDAYVVGQAAGGWTPSPFGNADWISYYSNATQSGSTVDIYFRYRFNLDPSVVPSTFNLGIDFYADNSVWEVYVNGVPQSGLVAGLPQSPSDPYFYGGFLAGNQAHLQLNRSWQTGTNEIVVQVRSGAPAIGFMGQVTASGLCPAQIGITKTANPEGSLTPNGTVTYTVTVTNTGLVPAPNTLISDTLPPGISSGTWTCSTASGAVCPNASGTMPIGETVATFPGGGVLTYTITGTVSANPPASVVNTATAAPTGYSQCYPDGGAPPCSASVANPPVPIVAITKTTDASEAVPGGPITYSIVARNTGSLDAGGTIVADSIPPGLVGASWTCIAAGGAICPNASGTGAISETIATFPPGATVTYTVDATVANNPPASLANTASATPPGGGVCNDGSAPPCESTVILPAAPQISIVKTANPTGVLAPNSTVTYTITVTNEGSVDAPSTLVRDPFPNGIDSATWTCAASGGAVCPNADSGGAVTPPADMLAESVQTFPPGGSVTYTITATVSATPPNVVTNTASASPPGGVCRPDNSPPPCTGTVSNPSSPVIAITKSADADILVPGGTVTYTVTISNVGTVDADGTLFNDPMPDGLMAPFTWTCAANGGAACPNASGSGDILESIATFPSGSSLVYTITATVVPNPPALIGNVAYATPPDGVCADGTPVPCQGTVVTPVAPQINIEKIANDPVFSPGGTLSWTIVVTNTGSVSADGTQVSDPLPAGIVSSMWTCAASGGATCANASGSGAISEAIAVFPPGSIVTYDVIGAVGSPAPASIANTAAATPPGDGRCDPGNTLPPCTSGTITPSVGFDFGDAPDTYGTRLAGDGARHGVGSYDPATNTAPLMLGSRIDIENDGFPSANADGDDLDGASDEDAFTDPIALQPGVTAVSLDVPVTNATGASANVYAWIDFNANGRFDAAEAGNCPAAPAGTASVTCTWTVATALVDGFQTYARFRITTQSLAAGTAPNGGDARAQSIANDGEVEDHRVVVATALPLTCETPFIETFRTYSEAPGAFPGWGTPLPAGTTTYVFQRGSATPQNTVGGGQYALMTTPRLSHVAWQDAPDHTPDDTDGFMMVVNADPSPGVFYRRTFSGLTVGARYSFFASLANIVAGLGAGLPNVTLRIVDPATNAILASVNTGNIPEDPAGAMTWHPYSLIFTATQAQVRVELANNSGVQGGNDLALDDIGFSQVCELGDAPDSYGTLNASNGAGHMFPGPGLSLGAGQPDGEIDGQPGTAADGDDLAGTDDENAFPSGPPSIESSAPYALSVPVDTSAADATVCAWVDFDQNGSFSAPEGQCQSLAAGTAVADFAWAAAATSTLTSGETYLRLRIERNGVFATDMTPADFSGARGPGEVEDYVVEVLAPANVAITKALSGESGSLPGIAEPGEQLTYAITLTNSGGVDATDYGVTDALDPNTTFVSASNGGSLVGSHVEWAGLTVPAGGTVTLTVVVSVNAPIPAGVTQVANVAYETGTTPPSCPPAGPECVIVPTAPHIAVAKTAGTPTPTGAPDEFTLTYTVGVTNTGGSAGTYELADIFAFNGATVSAVTPPAYSTTTGDTQTGTLGAFGAPAGGTIVTGEDLGVGGAETWTYTVTYTITDAALASDCANPLGGLRNSALIDGGVGGIPPAETCTGAASVAIVKTASVPLPTGNPNEFTLTYTVNVSNAGSLPGSYDLSDVLTFNGATISAISPPSYSSSTGDAQDGTLGTFGPPDGGVIVTGESIQPGGAETWTYTVTYAITDAATAQDCVDPNGGLRNAAALGGSMSGQSTTCTGAPAVSIGKSVSGPTPTGNPDEYTLNYVVTVQNNGSLAGTYDLDDAFAFVGVSNVTVSAVTHAGPDPLATPLGTLDETGGNIVTGESIAAGASESYAYTVTFTLFNTAAIGTCASGGGIVNNATLGGSAAGAVGTCSDIPIVGIVKSAGTPTATGTQGQYAITYTVTVMNRGAAAGSYDLADAFAFAGATVDAVSAVEHGGPDPLAATLGTLDATGGTIVTGETIAAGGSETYTYTVTLTIDDADVANDCAGTGGLRNTASLGGSTGGTATTCSGIPNVAIAKALTGESGTIPGVAEPGETLTYTITLTNSGDVDQTGFGLTDPLDPNVAFVSADNGGTFAGGTVTWSNLAIPAGGNLVVTVVVTVDDPIPAGVTTIGNVAYETGTTTPDCTQTPMPPNCVITPAEGVVAIVKSVTDANGNGLAEPGETLTYTITLTNTNGGDVTGYGVTDPLDANTTFVSASNGGAFAGGTVSWTNLLIPAGSSLALTVVATVNDPIPSGVTQIGNVAYETGTPPPDCTLNPRPANCTVIITPTPGTIAIAKSVADANGNGLAEPGETLTYTITLTNTNGGDVTGYGVTDPLDANTTFVSASNGGTFAGGTVTWTNLVIAADSSLALTVVVTVNNPIPAGITQIGNVAYETGTTPPDCTTNPRPANCTVIVTPPPGTIAIAKSVADANGNGQAEPGETLTYAITLTNSGGVVTGYGVTDPLDPNVVFVSADNGGAFAGGAVTWAGLTVPANGTLTLTVVVTVANPIPVGVTAIGNVAYQSGTTPPDCTASPLPPNCAVIVTPPPSGAPELLIQKTVDTTSATPGGTIVYTVAVSNVGTAAASNVVIGDPIPPGIASYAWTCAASGGAVCPNASGSGAVSETIATFPPGGAIVYTVTAVLDDNPPANIANVASVTPPGSGSCAPSGTPPPCTATVVVGVEPPGGGEPARVPATSAWALWMLAIGLFGIAVRAGATQRSRG